ncbi:transposase [uncultured Ruegeria sp.]|uniref:transposase n=1 Tax=uncultured Ruegeria sp. TaxID=259304 RepID=UPI00344F063E
MHAAKQNTLARCLLTVPGVGPIVALNLFATVDDTSRFHRLTDIGSFLGLTPRRNRAGEINRSCHIFKCEYAEMRHPLV